MWQLNPSCVCLLILTLGLQDRALGSSSSTTASSSTPPSSSSSTPPSSSSSTSSSGSSSSSPLSSSSSSTDSGSDGSSTNSQLPTTTDPVQVIQGAVSDVHNECSLKPSGADCSSEKTELLNLVGTRDDACEKMWEYVACVTVNCDSKPELTKAVDKIKKPCIGDPIEEIQGEITIVNRACTYSAGDTCANQENDLTRATTKADACTKMKDYTACLEDKCKPDDDLTTAINTMKKTCNGGPRLLQVSGLTFLLVAIVKFL